jgi:hypothetical protein
LAYADFLTRAGKILGSIPERDHGRRALSEAFDRVVEKTSPEIVPGLVRMRARLMVPDEMAALATIAFDLAEAHIGNGFGEGEQRFEGSINGNATVVPESVIDRAVFIHLVMGSPMPEAMVDGLIELYGAKDFHFNGNDAQGLSYWEKHFYDEFGGRPVLVEIAQEDDLEDSGYDISF